MNIKERKFLNNIQHFDLGKNQIIDSGRQSTTDVNPSTFSSTGAYTGYNNTADTYRSSILPQTMSNLAGGIGTVGTMFSNLTSNAAARAANIATIKSFADAAGAVSVNGTTLSANTISGLSGKQAAETVGQLGGNVAKAGLSAVGYVASALGTAQGLMNMFSGAKNFENRLHDTDLMAGSSTSTQTKFGRAYKQIGGFDESGVLRLTQAQNDADVANMESSGLSTGMSLGGGIGSIFGPVGTAVGTILKLKREKEKLNQIQKIQRILQKDRTIRQRLKQDLVVLEICLMLDQENLLLVYLELTKVRIQVI